MEKLEVLYKATIITLGDYYNIGLMMQSVGSQADENVGTCVQRYCESAQNDNPDASAEELSSIAVTRLQSDLGFAV